MSLPETGKTAVEFSRVADAAAPRLYHCAPVPLKEGDTLAPRSAYAVSVPADTRAALGLDVDGIRVPLVFASDSLQAVLPFAFRAADREKIIVTEIDGTSAPLVLLCNRDEAMSKPRDVTVYSFSGKDFSPLTNVEGRYVSTRAVSLAEATVAFKAKNADDLMRAGLQIFTVAGTHAKNGGWQAVEEAMDRRGLTFEQYLGEEVRAGAMVWENHARGIFPDPVLQERLAEYLQYSPELDTIAGARHDRNKSSPRL